MRQPILVLAGVVLFMGGAAHGATAARPAYEPGALPPTRTAPSDNARRLRLRGGGR